MTEFKHKSVMMAEVLEALQPKPGGIYADGTLGGAGHAAAVLAASSPTGRLLACDRDGVALEAAAQRLAEFAGRFELRRGLAAFLKEHPLVAKFDLAPMNQGGGGVTVVELKD